LRDVLGDGVAQGQAVRADQFKGAVAGKLLGQRRDVELRVGTDWNFAVDVGHLGNAHVRRSAVKDPGGRARCAVGVKAA